MSASSQSSQSGRFALQGVKVLELAGLAPGPFAGMILADFGADVIRVDRTNPHNQDNLARGKRSIALNLKSPEGTATLRKLCSKVDVIIDPFRPGVMEKMGVGPDVVLQDNPACVYARLTGFGQTGAYANMAGHDINYIAASGALSTIGRKGQVPTAPGNLLGDFAGGGMLCVMGILIALFERTRSGRGQVVDAAMVDGAAYLSAFIFKSKQAGLWNNPRGENLLDTGAPFYDVYETKDGKYMSVGALEPHFYAKFLKGMGLDPKSLPDQLDMSGWPTLRSTFAARFASKTRDEWAQIFDGTDACCVPVVELGEDMMSLQHNRDRSVLVRNGDEWEPRPAPVLSRTPASDTIRSAPRVGEHSVEVLSEFGFADTEIKGLVGSRVVMDSGARGKL